MILSSRERANALTNKFIEKLDSVVEVKTSSFGFKDKTIAEVR